MEFPEQRTSRDSFQDVQPDPPKHIMESPVVEDSMTDGRTYSDDVAPTPISHTTDHAAADVISLDSMRDNLRGAIVSNFEQDDLDVPAFLRKRNEVM
jgi:hypothetical protein